MFFSFTGRLSKGPLSESGLRVFYCSTVGKEAETSFRQCGWTWPINAPASLAFFETAIGIELGGGEGGQEKNTVFKSK